jgi:hypothetical protein
MCECVGRGDKTFARMRECVEAGCARRHISHARPAPHPHTPHPLAPEIEFPFGFEASDLPLEQFCRDLRAEIESMVASYRARDFDPSLWRFNTDKPVIQPPAPSTVASMAHMPHYPSHANIQASGLFSGHERAPMTASPAPGDMEEGSRADAHSPQHQPQPHHHYHLLAGPVEMEMVREAEDLGTLEAGHAQQQPVAAAGAAGEGHATDPMQVIAESSRESDIDAFTPYHGLDGEKPGPSK